MLCLLVFVFFYFVFACFFVFFCFHLFRDRSFCAFLLASAIFFLRWLHHFVTKLVKDRRSLGHRYGSMYIYAEICTGIHWSAGSVT